MLLISNSFYSRMLDNMKDSFFIFCMCVSVPRLDYKVSLIDRNCFIYGIVMNSFSEL